MWVLPREGALLGVGNGREMSMRPIVWRPENPAPTKEELLTLLVIRLCGTESRCSRPPFGATVR